MNKIQAPLISVIVPVYNTEKYLKRCLESILNQTYKNLEVIIVNDGTNDNSENIIKDYLINDNRVKYVCHSKNQGLFQARLSGLDEAVGEYIAFVDSDDYISMDFYSVLLKKAQKTEADITVCSTIFEYPDGRQELKQLHKLCFEKELLSGEEIKENFFKQQGACFSWHTIWNKLYKKTLWDKCRPYYNEIDRHLIMTEDLAFSTPLLYNAASLATAFEANYFYCQNLDASTGVQDTTSAKFKKKIDDIRCAFNFIENFLNGEKVSDKTKNNFLEFKKKYSRMYRSLQEWKLPKDEHAEMSVDTLLPDYFEVQKSNESFFDAISVPYNHNFDNIKQNIMDSEVTYVSFDIFDTLVVRPFLDPTDIFSVIEPSFEKITKCQYNISFKKLRIMSEENARRSICGGTDKEDVNISEIYDEMTNSFGVDAAVAKKMEELEKEYEIRFCTVRKAGKKLYDFTLNSGKQVIITSDMYLDVETVKTILEKNGYSGYKKLYLSSEQRRLKNTGNLFGKVIDDLDCNPEEILHIGDTWSSDIVAPGKYKIKTSFFPKTKEVYKNVIKGICTNNLSKGYEIISGPFAAVDSAEKTLGYRCASAVIANRIFDNPYESFNPQSDFNCDPYILGYSAVGPHILGISKWLKDSLDENATKNIYFLARDGYLPKKAFDIYSSALNNNIDSYYINASRDLTLPFFINSKADFYDLPVSYLNYTPLHLCLLLKFCLNEEDEDALRLKLKENDFSPTLTFAHHTNSKKYFESFVNFLLRELFDENKLKRSREIISKYYSQIKESSSTFDMGYSGRIQSAICEAAGKKIDGYFIHTDHERCYINKRKSGYKIHSFYQEIPASSGIMREYILSDIAPAVKEIKAENNNIKFEYKKDDKDYPEKFIVNTIHQGAIDFVEDFTDIFRGMIDTIDFEPEEMSAAFEYFLRYAKKEDLKMFSVCHFEDVIYGNIEKIRADEFFNNQLCDIKPYIGAQETEPRTKVAITEYSKKNRKKTTDRKIMVKREAAAVKPAIFFDKILPDESDEEKLVKCSQNTNNLLIWDAISSLIGPSVLQPWFMTRDGGFDSEDYDIYITTALISISQNQDFSWLKDVLTRIGDKILFPLEVGLESSEKTADFKLHSSTAKVLAEISERCKSIGVVGEYTAEILNKNGIKNCRIVGSTAIYKNFSSMKKIALDTEISSFCGSLRPFHGKLSNRETALLKYFAENGFTLIESTHLNLNADNVTDEKDFKLLKPYESRKKIYFSAEDLEKALKQVDFTMGMNLYNNFASIHANVPTLFINHNVGGKEICTYFGLPCLDISEFDDKKSVFEYYRLCDYSEFFKRIDSRYRDFCDFLSENGLSVSRWCGRIIKK